MAVGSTIRQGATGELRRFVDAEGASFPAIDLVWQVLRARGKLLAEGDGFSWGLIPLLVCEAAGGDPRLALPVSTAAECFISAADILDDVQDRDTKDGLWRVCGVAAATNVATFLLFLTQLALGRLTTLGVPDDRVLEVVRTFAAAGARACGGQQKDLDQGRARDIDEAGYLGMVQAKSAYLVECLCRSGAIVAGARADEVEAFARFGLNVGMALQLANDTAAASAERSDRNDLRMGKPSLSMIFALECGPEGPREELAGLLRRARAGCLGPNQVDRVHSLLAASGALHYAVAVADVYWERALSSLDGLGRDQMVPLFDLIAQMRGG
jgi:geranylgeranyl pyrophosphate synthase